MKRLFIIALISFCVNLRDLTAQKTTEVSVYQSNESINTSISVSCPSWISLQNKMIDGIMVTGENIFLSDLVDVGGGMAHYLCRMTRAPVFFVILSSNSFVIDDDFNGGDINMTVIAPNWVVIGNRTISFDGASGGFTYRNISTVNSLFQSLKGFSGESGESGKTGGAFYGIGKTFINESSLTITANGGDGGPGGGGGAGEDGMDGVTPAELQQSQINCEKAEECIKKDNVIVEPVYSLCTRERLDYINCSANITYDQKTKRVTCRLELLGHPGYRGWDGGRGGSGGVGGHPGIIEVVDLSDRSGISLQALPGEPGENGMGGPGGNGGLRGESLVYSIKKRDGKTVSISWDRVHVEEVNEQGLTNEWKTEPLINHYPTRKQWLGPSQTDRIVKEYGIFLRESLKEKSSFLKKYLTPFYSWVDRKTYGKRCTIYSVYQLADQLRELEEDFHKFNQTGGFLVLYEALLDKIQTHMEPQCTGNWTNSMASMSMNQKTWETQIKPQNLKLLRYLYTATLGRVYSLKDYKDTIIVINIGEFFNSVQKTVKELKEVKGEREKFLMVLSKLNTVKEHKTNYGKYISDKFNEANMIITTQVLPEIDKINERTMISVDKLLDEIEQFKQKQEEELEKLREKEKKLREALVVHSIFSVFKVIGTALSFIPVVGPMVSAGVGMVITAAETTYDYLNPAIEETPEFSSLSNDISDFKIEYNKYKNQTSYDKKPSTENPRETKPSTVKPIKKNPTTNKPIKKNPTTNKPIKNNPTTDKPIKKNPTTDKPSDKNPNTDKPRDKNPSTYKPSKRAPSTYKPSKNNPSTKKPTKTERGKKAVGVAKTLMPGIKQMVDRYKNDNNKLETVTRQIAESEQALERTKEFENNIRETFKPAMKEMGNNLKSAAKGLEGKSHAAIDLTKWRIQGMLRNVMRKVKQVTNGFKVQEEMMNCVEDMNAAMGTLIELFDQIQDYQEKLNLANHYADLTAASATDVNITNPEFRNITHHLQLMIASNVVLQKHQEAVNALKQFVFPFAHLLFNGWTLPTTLTASDSLEDLVNTAADQVDHLVKRLNDYKHTIKRQDNVMGLGKFDSKFDSAKPFYTWKNMDHRDSISELFSCKEVELKADIKHSPRNEDAIKFNVLRFVFKINKDYSSLQSKLDKILRTFEVKATHMGTSYYRFENKTYMIITNSLSFWYNIEKDDKGKPVRRDISYDKLVEGDYSLSPFALWKLQLIDLTDDYSCEDLQEFADKVDIELEGEGHYVRAGRSINTQLHVDSYYTSLNLVQPEDVEDAHPDVEALMKISWQISIARQVGRQKYREQEAIREIQRKKDLEEYTKPVLRNNKDIPNRTCFETTGPFGNGLREPPEPEPNYSWDENQKPPHDIY